MQELQDKSEITLETLNDEEIMQALQNKSEITLDKLPYDVLVVIAGNLSTLDIIHLRRTVKRFEFFQPILNDRHLAHSMHVREFLDHVMHSNYEEVRRMLAQDSRLLFAKENQSDPAGRHFQDISGFQYALWALDAHMWQTILACVPVNEENQESYLAQYNAISNQGLTYLFENQTINESHYDFAIINALEEQRRLQVAPWKKDSGVNDHLESQAAQSRLQDAMWLRFGGPVRLKKVDVSGQWTKNCSAINEQWIKGVGGAQKKLPMHIVDWYCSSTPFYPLPSFKAFPLPSKNKPQQIYNYTKGDYGTWENWMAVDSKLGSNFAVYKGGERSPLLCAAVTWEQNFSMYGGFDLDAMQRLREVRTEGFTKLKLQLEKPLSRLTLS